ncbi:hypothetical protein [Sphingomonas sp.]|uniref:hypothetical protein n=1 Tax=Sphingomonas sp. TaxID=28214 RepID=UPI002EDB3B2B
MATTVLVPEALRRYLARRCGHVDALLADLLRDNPVGRTLSIPAVADVYRGIDTCSLGVTTLLRHLQSAVEITLVLKNDVIPSVGRLAVHAGATSTDLVLPHLFDSWRASVSHGLLRDKFGIPFLRPELVIEELVDEGAGVRIRCQPVVTNLDLADPTGDQGLHDAYGHVSGSSRRF